MPSSTAHAHSRVASHTFFAQGPPPSILAVSPDHGPCAGAFAITIAGSDFRAGVTVLVGGLPCGNVVVTAATGESPAGADSVITCSAPAELEAATRAAVEVINEDGTHAIRGDAILFQVW